jgi:hypothetical protein
MKPITKMVGAVMVAVAMAMVALVVLPLKATAEVMVDVAAHDKERILKLADAALS